ncbi:MAG: hypothetical protein Alpg2KO_05850 [Alphaproteobacteria bacterium]
MTSTSGPRLIVLDTVRAAPTERLFAQKLSRALRWQDKAPQIILPLADCVKLSERDDRNQLAVGQEGPMWDRSRKQVMQALEQGQDVILLAPLSQRHADGQDWVNRLARQTGARVFAGRAVAQFGPKPLADETPDHIWPRHLYKYEDEGASGARRLSAAIERAIPGACPVDKAGKPLSPSFYVIEDRDALRRAALTKALIRETGAMALDLAQVRVRLSPKSAAAHWDPSPMKDKVIDREVWDHVEQASLAALRSGQPLVLTGDDVSSPLAREVADMLGRVVDGSTQRIRIQSKAGEMADRDDGFASMLWPGSDRLEKAANLLARAISTEDNAPDLNDLLDLPPSNRRHLARTLSRTPRI